MLGLPSAGAVRVSLGVSSQPGDVHAFLRLLRETYRDRTPAPDGLPARAGC
ncbi:hypothetical protein ACWEO4_09375 [Streptomyces sp. NPDC004393]|uniref:hypothetical protein n=1 Tax=Streptomyces sp. NPDC004533 TaxID=3154278 RepID=UPI0033BD7602